MSPKKDSKTGTPMPSGKRTASLERNTKETQIRMSIDLDGAGTFTGSSGIPFFDHMLDLFAKHGKIDVRLQMAGDLEVECHHSVEDVGITLGQLLAKAVGDKKGIRRFGRASVPMEETLVETTLDFCGRAFLHWGLPEIEREMIGNYATEMTEDFFRAVVNNAGLTVHFDCPRGRNAHHLIEAAFKSFARALREAASPDERSKGEIPSTKGAL